MLHDISGIVTFEGSYDSWVGELVAALRPHWRKKPVLFKPSGLPIGVPDTATLENMLDSGLLHVPYVQVFVGSNPIATDRFSRNRLVFGTRESGFVDAGMVRNFLAEGATVMLPRLDHWYQPVNALAEAMSKETQHRVDAFQFYTPPGEQGLPIHRDDADVVLIQTAGSKRWAVYPGPVDGMWNAGKVAEPGDAIFEDELSAGEVLYIPRGFGHAGIAGDRFSAHLSLVIGQVGASEMRSALTRAIAKAAPDLPPRPLDEPSLVHTATRLLTDVQQLVASLSPERLVEMANEAAFQKARQELGFLDS
jgi:ribosomal protein L16 Arg81 hydroxylase